jgi:hypothetical protein
MDPGLFFYILITVYYLLALFTISQTTYYLLPHDMFNPLFTANRWDRQPHCKLGQSTLVVLCAGSTLLLVQSYTLDKAPYINCLDLLPSQRASTSEVGSFSYWFDKPWFHTEGRLAVVLIIPSSWGSQLGGHLYAISGSPQPLLLATSIVWKSRNF